MLSLFSFYSVLVATTSQICTITCLNDTVRFLSFSISELHSIPSRNCYLQCFPYSRFYFYIICPILIKIYSQIFILFTCCYRLNTLQSQVCVSSLIHRQCAFAILISKPYFPQSFLNLGAKYCGSSLSIPTSATINLYVHVLLCLCNNVREMEHS